MPVPTAVPASREVLDENHPLVPDPKLRIVVEHGKPILSGGPRRNRPDHRQRGADR